MALGKGKMAERNPEISAGGGVTFITFTPLFAVFGVQGRKRGTMKHKKLLWWFALIVSVLTFAIAAYLLLPYTIDSCKAKNDFRQMEQLIGASAPKEPSAASMPVANQTPRPMQSQEQQSAQAQSDVLSILPQYEQLHQAYPDLFGWLIIENLNMDYPVMYTPNRPQFYLYRDVNGNHSNFGVPFLDEACFYDCGNYIIHGHRMRNGSIFGSLYKYEDAAYCSEYPYIRFNTLYDEGLYQILAVVHTRIIPSYQDGFRYYEHPELLVEEDFNAYIDWAKSNSLFDTGVDAVYGDDLITLSTCSYHTENGRLAIVAKRIQEPSN